MSKNKTQIFDAPAEKVTLVILLLLVVIMGATFLRNEEKIADKCQEPKGDMILYYDLYIGGEKATADEIQAVIRDVSDFRDGEGNPMHVAFKRVRSDDLCEEQIRLAERKVLETCQ